MAVSLQIKTNATQVSQKFKDIESILPRLIDKGLLQAGFQLLDIVKTKTKKGIDFRDIPFAAYSQGYLKKLKAEGKPTNVDLWYSGRMLGSLTPDTTIKPAGKYKVTLGFNNSEMRKRAVFNQVLGKNKREFFGFNERTKQIIQKSFNLFMQKEFTRYTA
jgi:hypothetical protein